MTSEELRLEDSRDRKAHWKRWGPYLSERAWGTVREDYSADGTAWEYLPHDHARSRAYRWNEDGLAGICDRHQKICFALALWNGRDPILKERLFGLTGNEGNHGEDVKECYFYLDSTPTHSYMKYLYKYPQAAFPYERLRRRKSRAAARRSRNSNCSTRASSTRIATSTSSSNTPRRRRRHPGPHHAWSIAVPKRPTSHLLPTVWFRNTWSWGNRRDPRPELHAVSDSVIELDEPHYGRRWLRGRTVRRSCCSRRTRPTRRRLYRQRRRPPYVKDGINDYVVHGDRPR